MSIIEDRARHYGPGDANLSRIAAMWSGYLGLRNPPLTAHDVCWMMTLVKASRARQDGGQHLDNFVDAHGYITLAEQFRDLR